MTTYNEVKRLAIELITQLAEDERASGYDDNAAALEWAVVVLIETITKE